MEYTPPSPQDLYQKQSDFFRSGKTRSVEFRRDQIKLLIAAVKKNENRIYDALWKDMRKSHTAAYTGEILLILKEASYVLSQFEKWSKPKRTPSLFFLHNTSSIVFKEPYGSVLIISPYNVPFLGTLGLLSSAIAAGNCAVIKASELSKHSTETLIDIIHETFPKEYISVITGDKEYSEQLLRVPFDYFFFMGSTAVGKLVMSACANHPAPLSLQLSGRCPAIVDTTASIDAAAKRIVWAKFLNAGQECVSINHVYIPEQRREVFIAALKKYIRQFYGEDPQQSPDFERIINEHHVNRILRFLDEGTIVSGGRSDIGDRYIEPTIIDQLPENSLASREEIFGPVLPLFSYTSRESLIAMLNKNPSPLALYIFSNDTEFQQYIISNTPSGSVCINDAVVQNASFYVPIGGVGTSGFGRIHGRYSFEMFSRLRTVIKRNPVLDLPGRYPPANEKLLPLIKRLLE